MGGIQKTQRLKDWEFRMTIARRWVWVAVIALLVVQAAHFAYVVHRESFNSCHRSCVLRKVAVLEWTRGVSPHRRGPETVRRQVCFESDVLGKSHGPESPHRGVPRLDYSRLHRT